MTASSSDWTPPDAPRTPHPPPVAHYTGPGSYTPRVVMAPPRYFVQTAHRPGVPLADLGRRFAAHLIDQLIFGGVFCVLAIPVVIVSMDRYPEYAASGGSADMPGPVFAMNLVLSLGMLIILAVYQAYCVATWGATIGKRAMKLRVVRVADGGPVGWGQAAGRAGIVLLFSIPPLALTLVGLIALLDYAWALWDKPNKQTLHDKAARTVVIRVDPHAPHYPVVWFTG